MEDETITGVLRGWAGLVACLAGLAFHAPAAAQAQAAASTITVTGIARPVPPDLFGTVAVPARISRYSAAWYRSRIDATRHPALQRLIAPARGLAPDAKIAFVQSAVHQRIRWMSDATEWGAHDYWASAAQTLERGAGDMEDRAIVKLQALRALGFRGSDLYLTMGRDKVGGPITVLIVRAGKRFFVLDDLGGKPIAAERREGFEPVMTFGANATWIHGRRMATGRRSGAPRAASDK